MMAVAAGLYTKLKPRSIDNLSTSSASPSSSPYMSSISKANDNNGDQKRQQQQPQQLVCVTGAGGFIGSWVVRELLLRGYRVRATVRDPADRKNAHLLALEGADERLSLRRADVLDFDGLLAVFAGCHGVFHVACPLSNRDPVSSLPFPCFLHTLSVI